MLAEGFCSGVLLLEVSSPAADLELLNEVGMSGLWVAGWVGSGALLGGSCKGGDGAAQGREDPCKAPGGRPALALLLVL